MNAVQLIWLIPVLPLLGALLNGVIGWKFEPHEKRKVVTAIALASTALSLLLALWNIWYVSTFPWDAPPQLPASVTVDAGHHSLSYTLGEWIEGGEFTTGTGATAKFTAAWKFVLDPLSAVMLFVVAFIGFLIHVYSVGYMAHDEGYWRYFSYLNLFMAMMLTLVLGGNYLVMFVGWEGVGLCSYLLIGFYYRKDFCADAGKKAFLTNRIGDMGFAAGLMLILYYFGTLDMAKVNELAASGASNVPAAIITAAALLLFVGATGKSAQVPLYVWLPDAMAGPTPVSALIHAATMVTSGVYLVARSNGLYSMSPTALGVVAGVGCLTALFAASIGLVQNDIKKVLAYSTVSQLGYMFLGVGVGAYAAGVFHLYTHAFFKALLFLGSGSVIHAMSGEQDIRKMGQLWSRIPHTARTFLIGCIAIAGIPPLSGFFSKDEILWMALSSDNGIGHFPPLYAKALFFVGVLAATMTAFYMFRLFYLTFFGNKNIDHEAEHHLHESPKVMTTPLWILAIGAIVAGYVGLPKLWVGESGNLWEHWLKPTLFKEVHETGHASAALEWGAMLLSIAVAVLGIWIATKLYKRYSETPRKLAEKAGGLYRLVLDKYRVDELYSATVIGPLVKIADGLSWFDKWIVDGVVNGIRHLTVGASHASLAFDKVAVDGAGVNGTAAALQWFSKQNRRFQTGEVQNYALGFIVGFIVIIIWYLFL
ncbi:MAG TPA: NADH-quinone oxidoreductase subunit L [Acidobacteriota bacterium]|nr:NADH-quinone oxidoreductase subunit L [Acidobacteriota bacterium]